MNTYMLIYSYNKKTGDVVFAIQVRNWNETTPHGYFSYRRPAKKSIVLSDSVTILFSKYLSTLLAFTSN